MSMLFMFCCGILYVPPLLVVETLPSENSPFAFVVSFNDALEPRVTVAPAIAVPSPLLTVPLKDITPPATAEKAMQHEIKTRLLNFDIATDPSQKNLVLYNVLTFFEKRGF
jgi:hypothetical protein